MIRLSQQKTPYILSNQKNQKGQSRLISDKYCISIDSDPFGCNLASVTADLVHSLDALAALTDIQLSAAFEPQHGLRGDSRTT